MKTLYKIICSLFLLLPLAHSQTSSWTFANASPEMGWDNFSKLIGYPEIMRRMGAQGSADVRFSIDSVGYPRDIIIVAPEYITDHVLETIQNTKWTLSPSDTGFSSYSVHFELQFNLMERPGNDKLKTLRINVPYPKVKIDY